MYILSNHVSQSSFRLKRRKLEHLETVDEEEIEGEALFIHSALFCYLSFVLFISNFETVMLAEASSSKGECQHPGSFGNMCFVCGQKLEETGVSFRYIHKVSQFIQLPYKSSLGVY